MRKASWLKSWQKHEKYIQELLELDSTIASGNTFSDPGDAISRSHYSELEFRLYAEAKCTTKKSFTLLRHDISGYARRAMSIGKTFVMPIRFTGEDGIDEDYILLRIFDFSAILSRAQGSEHIESVKHLENIVKKIRDKNTRLEAQHHLKRLSGE